MAKYHVRISEVGRSSDEVKLDLDEQALERQFLRPYRKGTSITINGRTIAMEDIERIRIGASDVSSDQLIATVKHEEAQSSVVVFGGPSYEWQAAARAKDVTDQFITGPPGEHTEEQGLRKGPDQAEWPETHSERRAADGNKVFLVTGRDTPVTKAVAAFLRALGLKVIEWEHAVAKTGVPNPYVGEVVEAGLRMANAGVVLITPDDLVRLRDDLLRDDDPATERELVGQARPNVFYEAGFADAIGRERTVIVEVGQVKGFSDAVGRHVVRYDGTAGKRNSLAERLRVAGLVVDTSGEDWLEVGDIGAELARTNAALRAAKQRAPGKNQ